MMLFVFYNFIGVVIFTASGEDKIVIEQATSVRVTYRLMQKKD